MSENKPNGSGVGAANSQTGSVSAATMEPPREKLTKKAITADHPTWCPGCGDFAVLASFYKILEKRNIDHEKIVTLAGIGCSSRFPKNNRSEEHTSELQSQFHLVCRLLLEKKKKETKINT